MDKGYGILKISICNLLFATQNPLIAKIGNYYQQYIIMACRDIEIDFIVQDNNPEMASVEDDIVENLKEIGIKVNTRVSYDTSETIMTMADGNSLILGNHMCCIYYYLINTHTDTY